MSKLQRIHSMTKRAVAMRESDVSKVVTNLETIFADDSFASAPALRNCIMKDGWVPIASILNYSPVGKLVWPFGGVGVVADSVSARGSLIVEVSGDHVCVRRKPLRVQLRDQLEYIYSDANYPRDVHLQLLEDREGFAKLDVVCATYAQTRAIVQRLELSDQRTAVLREAVASSSELELRLPTSSEEGSGLVRRLSLLERIPMQVEHYLDPDRMAADRFLIETARDNAGFVPIATLLTFPRMRKLCHPQVAAVAHVLSKSPKLEVSPDATLVRPRLKPPESPAKAIVPGGSRQAVITAVERLLNDANLSFDRQLQAAIAANSPQEALASGGLGVRVAIEDLVGHPEVEAVLADAEPSLLSALRAHRNGSSEVSDAAMAAGGLLLRKRVVELLPRAGESPLVRVSSCGRFVERLEATPEVRQMVPPVPGVSGPRAEAPVPDESAFTVMTYNVLADMLCTCEQFPGVAVEVLDWRYRRALIVKEVLFHCPDVCCLQELQGTPAAGMDGDHRGEVARALAARGYDHRYVRKVKRDGTSWAHAQIGNAVFWRAAAFEYVEHDDICLAPLLNSASVDEPSAAHFGRGAQVGLAVVLRHSATGRVVVAVTTHLSCNFQEPCTQIAQVQAVLIEASKVAARHGPRAGVVLCGDFNSMPGSGVYELVTSGVVLPTHPHMHINAAGLTMPAFGDHGGAGRALSHPLRLASAYNAVLGQEPLFTNFTGPPSSFVGTLDYVFFQPSCLRPTHVLTLPSEDTVRKERCLPSSRFPSDHLPLLTRFAFADAGPEAAAARAAHEPVPRIQVPPVPGHGGAGLDLGAEGAEEAEDMLISPKRSRDGELLKGARVANGASPATPAQGASTEGSANGSPALDPSAAPFPFHAAASGSQGDEVVLPNTWGSGTRTQGRRQSRGGGGSKRGGAKQRGLHGSDRPPPPPRG